MPKKNKIIISSESDSDKNSESDSDNSDSDTQKEKKFNVHEYRKLLAELYPSKHMNKKVKTGEVVKKRVKQTLYKLNPKKCKHDSEEEEEEDDEESEEEQETNRKQKKHRYNTRQKGKSNKKKIKEESEEEEESEEDDDEESEEYEEEEDDEESEEEEEEDDSSYVPSDNSAKKEKINVVLTISGKNIQDVDEDYSDYDVETEDEDEPVSSDEESESETKSSKKNKKSSSKSKKDVEKLSPKNTEHLEQTLVLLKELQEKKSDNTIISELVKNCESKIKLHNKKKEKKDLKQRDKNIRIFEHLVNKRSSLNDMRFFREMELSHQIKLIKELKEINNNSIIKKSYKITLLETDIPINLKVIAMQKIQMLEESDPGDTGYTKNRNWIDTFMKIPFNAHTTLPITIADGVDACHDFMENAQKTLNSAVYGLNDAKMQIMQMLGNLIANPNSIGSSIAICGPPGTGKTSLIKEGISKILNRPFAFIALGGASDGSHLEGHSYTYEGSTWGKIVQILIDSKCMNPIIYFDELDKISESPKGDEITGILTHLTDATQNDKFHDKYFSDIDFNLSKCLFIFSYNDESKINPILKDRMYKIHTTGYNQKQKTIIARNYLLDRIREQVKFASDDIIIPDAGIHHIIDNYCNKEDGVRNLKRCLEIIHTKLNLYRLMRPGTNLFEEDMSLKVAFPFTVTKDVIDKLIKTNKETFSALNSMYC